MYAVPPTPLNALDTDKSSSSDHTLPLDHKYSMAELAANGTTEQATVEPAESLKPDEHTDRTQHPQAHLLGIPKELLNSIVELVVVSPEPIRVRFISCEGCANEYYEVKCPHPIKVDSNPPALATVCKALASTVLPIYYGQNTFRFPSIASAVNMLAHVSSLPYNVTTHKVIVALVPLSLLDKLMRGAGSPAGIEAAFEADQFDARIEVRADKKSGLLEMSLHAQRGNGICEGCLRDINDALAGVNSTSAGARLGPASNDKMESLFREMQETCKRKASAIAARGGRLEVLLEQMRGGCPVLRGLGNCQCIKE